MLEPETLLFAARHGRPVVNGAGAFTPLYTATFDRSRGFRLLAEAADGDRIYEIVRATVEAQGGRP